jgi:Glucose-repressible protein Grg1
MDFVKDKVNQVSETIQGKGAEASAEQNKREFTRDSFQVVLY